MFFSSLTSTIFSLSISLYPISPSTSLSLPLPFFSLYVSLPPSTICFSVSLSRSLCYTISHSVCLFYCMYVFLFMSLVCLIQRVPLFPLSLSLSPFLSDSFFYVCAFLRSSVCTPFTLCLRALFSPFLYLYFFSPSFYV